MRSWLVLCVLLVGRSVLTGAERELKSVSRAGEEKGDIEEEEDRGDERGGNREGLTGEGESEREWERSVVIESGGDEKEVQEEERRGERKGLASGGRVDFIDRLGDEEDERSGERRGDEIGVSEEGLVEQVEISHDDGGDIVGDVEMIPVCCNSNDEDAIMSDKTDEIAIKVCKLLDDMERIITAKYTGDREVAELIEFQHSLNAIHNRTYKLFQHCEETNVSFVNTSKLRHENAHESVGDVFLQFLGLMGLMVVFGRFSYLCLSGLFVPSIAFVCDFAREIPFIISTALVFPYLLMTLEIVGVSYIFFGQSDHSSSYFLMHSLLGACESVITNSTVLKYCGILIIFLSLSGIMYRNDMMQRVLYD